MLGFCLFPLSRLLVVLPLSVYPELLCLSLSIVTFHILISPVIRTLRQEGAWMSTLCQRDKSPSVCLSVCFSVSLSLSAFGEIVHQLPKNSV